jgi:hypothetical protein
MDIYCGCWVVLGENFLFDILLYLASLFSFTKYILTNLIIGFVRNQAPDLSLLSPVFFRLHLLVGDGDEERTPPEPEMARLAAASPTEARKET